MGKSLQLIEENHPVSLQTPPGSLPSNLSSSSSFECAPAEEKGTEVLVTLLRAAPSHPQWQNLAKDIWPLGLTPCVPALSCMDILSFDQTGHI